MGERDTSAAILITANFIGMALGTYIPTIWVGPVRSEDVGHGITTLSLVLFIASIIGCLMSFIFFQSKPNIPPSLSRYHIVNDRKSLQKLSQFIQNQSNHNNDNEANGNETKDNNNDNVSDNANNENKQILQINIENKFQSEIKEESETHTHKKSEISNVSVSTAISPFFAFHEMKLCLMNLNFIILFVAYGFAAGKHYNKTKQNKTNPTQTINLHT